MKDQIKIKAPAKINLTLDVLGKRTDGYHELQMIMQTIDIYDVLTIQKRGKSDINLFMNKELPDKIPPEKNLVYKAAVLMQKTFSLPYGFDITLEKNIPAAAGLAGGSTDCAATLIAINSLCSLNLTAEELCDIGVELGADVPFCIKGGTMLSEGIGEILTPLPELEPLYAVLIKPNSSVSTAEIYNDIDSKIIYTHPNTELVMNAIQKKDMVLLSQNLSNVLELSTIPKLPVIADLKEFFLKNGALGALMSGSGPTTYGLYNDKLLAEIAYKTALELYKDYDVVLCQTKRPD